MSSFAAYLLGFLIIIAGLVYGATLLGVARHWIIVGVVVLLGIGLVRAVSTTRRKGPSDISE
jgi:hypothetical protein